MDPLIYRYCSRCGYPATDTSTGEPDTSFLRRRYCIPPGAGVSTMAYYCALRAA